MYRHKDTHLPPVRCEQYIRKGVERLARKADRKIGDFIRNHFAQIIEKEFPELKPKESA